MATKKDTELAMSKAFDGGQAAQAGGFPEEGNPFEEGTDEHDEWQRGFDADLEEKWTSATRAITQEITN